MIYKPTAQSIQKACEELANGNLVIFPTETVYGLGGDALNDYAIAKIYDLKKRPTFNPLITHVASIEQALEYCYFTEQAKKLAHLFWPGPLTLVLERTDYCPISLLATAGLNTIAIRVPANPIILELISTYNRPLVAPSANMSMHMSTTTAEDAFASFSRLGEEHLKLLPMILDGGKSMYGVESTVIDMTTPKPCLLRPGAITVEEIEDVIGPINKESSSCSIRSPGMMKRHYAPHLPLRINALAANEDEAFLGFGPQFEGKCTLNLSKTGDLKEAAANLFSMLRALDSHHYKGIAVAPIPTVGLGLAINDRLMRASVPADDELLQAV